VTEELIIAVISIGLLATVWLMGMLKNRLPDTSILPLLGLGVTIVGGIALVWTMLRIAAREIR
jgi:hypothetical protein